VTSKLEQHKIEHIQLGINTSNIFTSVGGSPLTTSGHVLTFNYDSNDFQLSGNNLQIKDSSIDHDSLANTHNLTTDIDHGSVSGLSDDDHSQYALLAGRAGGQTLIGDTASGGDLKIQSSSHGTKGSIFFGAAGNSFFDEANERFSIGQVYFSAVTEDKISLYGNRFGASNMYGFGVETGFALYSKAHSRHRWYIGANADGGTSDIMELDASTLQINASISFSGGVIGTVTVQSSDTDALDVSGVSIVTTKTTAGNITIGGLANGVAGQIVIIVKNAQANSLIIEHDEATGTQKIYTAGAADVTFNNFGGMVLICTGTSWFEVAQ